MAVKIKKADADKTLAAVKKAFKSWCDAGTPLPKLVKDYNTGYGTAPYAILWEEGPFEWTLYFPHGGIEEEFGFKLPDVSGAVPDGVFCEPINHWALAIYEN